MAINFAFRTKITELFCSMYINNITSVEIRKGANDGWILTSLDVVNGVNNESTSFQCNCLIGDGAFDASGVARTLMPGLFTLFT